MIVRNVRRVQRRGQDSFSGEIGLNGEIRQSSTGAALRAIMQARLKIATS